MLARGLERMEHLRQLIMNRFCLLVDFKGESDTYEFAVALHPAIGAHLAAAYVCAVKIMSRAGDPLSGGENTNYFHDSKQIGFFLRCQS